MSNALAIASVTRLLKDLLNDAFINGDVSGDVGGEINVTASPPDRIRTGDGADPTQLNVFLHRVTPNPALSNADLPTRDARGMLVQRPQLALDLHYLLTAYAPTDLGAEILLGYAMELFHENPILPRNVVRQALATGVNGSSLPPAFQGQSAARLADQLELIKITPEPLSLDDMSKVWTAFQTNYRPTVAYLVSVVLIQRQQPTRSALPVLFRGPFDPTTKRDRGVAVAASPSPRVPTLTAVRPPFGQPSVRLADSIALVGFNLDAGDARVLFTHAVTGTTLELGPVPPPRPDRLNVQLPAGAPLPSSDPLFETGSDPGSWTVGTYRVRVRFRAGSAGPERETSSVPMVLAPRTVPSATSVVGGVEVAVACEPRIRQQQAVSIVIGQDEFPLPALGADADTVSIERSDLVSGARLAVRLRVDGIESFVVDYSEEPPALDASQTVNVP